MNYLLSRDQSSERRQRAARVVGQTLAPSNRFNRAHNGGAVGYPFKRSVRRHMIAALYSSHLSCKRKLKCETDRDISDQDVILEPLIIAAD